MRQEERGRLLSMKDIILTIVILALFLLVTEIRIEAASSKIYYNHRVVAVQAGGGYYTYKPIKGDNTPALEYLLNNDKPLKLQFPIGSVITINSVVDIGSNKLLNATGATVIQQTREKGVLKNTVDGCNYNAVHNVTIVGGTWKNRYNTAASTMVRFAHGANLKFKNMKVITNYKGHALELIACKDVKVTYCTLKAENNATRSSTSVEDALQIDVATPTTAPGVYKETGYQGKYVNGQTCKNIRVEKCTIYGSRGICANYARTESRFYNSYHQNITIYNCRITGTSSQGIAMYNTIGSLVQGNVIKTTSSQRGSAYTTGLHYHLFGTKGGGTNRIVYNRIYATERGIYMNTNSAAKYGNTIIKGNRIYVKGSLPMVLLKTSSVLKAINRTGRW